MVASALPVSIITGFLGSGKTTLLNHLLEHASFKDSLVIINEFGEVAIDHLLVSTPSENIRLLSSGCLCCEMRGDLVDTLTDVFRKRASAEIPAFNRILIETTGLADPVPIVQSVVTDSELAQIYHLDTVVGVVDALHASTQLGTHDEVRKQIAVSDVLLLSKTDLIAPDAISDVEMAVSTMNATAEIIRVICGRIDPESLFGRGRLNDGARETDLENWLGLHRHRTHGKNHGSGTSYHAVHSDDIRTFSLCHEGSVSSTGLTTWLSMLASFRGPQLLRVKGIVNVSGNPVIIQAVQTVIHEPVPLKKWPSSDTRTRIVFIVRDLDLTALEKTFNDIAVCDSIGDAQQFDPGAYERFVTAARSFF